TAEVDDEVVRQGFHFRRSYYTQTAVPDRSNAQGDKRRLLLDAAVRVFARKGYHAARVGDIAEEAGVAYGLLYHYFDSKEDVLRSVFRETDGSIRRDLDARLASYVFYGAIDELLTGSVLGRLPYSDDDLARAEHTVVEIVTGELAPDRAGEPA